jgi:two-component system response regulator
MQDDLVEILIVEDSAQDLEMTLRVLRKHHLANHVETARDGEEALDFIFGRGKFEGRNTERTPRVILLDLKLPKVDGIDVLRQLKADPRSRMIPVVALTSSAAERDRYESYSLGVNSYIVKPIEFESFARAIAEIGFYWIALNRTPG